MILSDDDYRRISEQAGIEFKRSLYRTALLCMKINKKDKIQFTGPEIHKSKINLLLSNLNVNEVTHKGQTTLYFDFSSN